MGAYELLVLEKAKKALERRFGQALGVSYHWLTYGVTVKATDDETGSWVKFYQPSGSKRGRVIDEYDGAKS